MDENVHIPAPTAALMYRAANEGIPAGAIARVFSLPFDAVTTDLRHAHDLGIIGAVPKADWPPGQHSDARLPTVPRSANIDDVAFACKQVFKLTNLEAGFLIVLLRYACAEKEKLHGVVEQLRLTRQFRPNDTQETTDPKMVDVVICHLRKKLRTAYPDLNGIIQTSWGKGYYIAPADKAALYTVLGVNHGLDAQDQ